jgi:hypothetical protein
MAENSTGDAVRVVGAERPHPAVRQLARACIAMARWHRKQARTDTTAAQTDSTTPPRRPV